MVPEPAEPKCTLPGLALALFTRSASDLKPLFGPATITPLTVAMRASGTMSRSTLYGTVVMNGIDYQRARSRDADGVAVGRRLDDGIDADRAAGADPVLDHHRLLERIAHRRRDCARQHVGRSASGERHDQPDRLGRIVLRGERRRQQQHKSPQQRRECPRHGLLPWVASQTFLSPVACRRFSWRRFTTLAGSHSPVVSGTRHCCGDRERCPGLAAL